MAKYTQVAGHHSVASQQMQYARQIRFIMESARLRGKLSGLACGSRELPLSRAGIKREMYPDQETD